MDKGTRALGRVSSTFSAAIEIARATVADQLDAGNVEAAVPQIEELMAEQFGDYFGTNDKSEPLFAEGEPLTAEGVREILSVIVRQVPNRAGIIYVIAQPEKLQLILFTPEGKAIYKSVNVPRETVLQVAKEFREKITSPRLRNTTSYQASAQQLYKWIVAPLEADLQVQKIETLLFSMDTGLRSLPLAALYDGQNFLIEKYSLSLIPSISLTDLRYQSIQNSRVLAMGASEFSSFSPLLGVPLELQAIAKESHSPEYFLNQQFTLDNLQKQRRQYPYEIIHLATHGEFNPGNPNNSFIQLWDTKLQLNQLRTLGWDNPQVQLLVLSACRTAVGDDKAELGFAGLAVKAGVKSALASLWYVSDEATLGLMSEFYRQLRSSPMKAEALRLTQLAMIADRIYLQDGKLMQPSGSVPLPPTLAKVKNKQLSHPYYWAGFTLIGSPW